MTVVEAREVLWDEFIEYADSEIEELIELLLCIAKLIISNYSEKKAERLV